MERTGEWYAPDFWSADVLHSPFEVEEVDAAFSWLKQVYRPRVAKRVFRKKEQPLLSLLADFHAIRLSNLVSLGMLGVLADPPTRLIRRLRHADQYFGARNELEVMAALTAAGIESVFEPLRDAPDGGNPDFLLPSLGDGLLLDVKRGGMGACNEEAERIARRITGMDDCASLRLGRHTIMSFTQEMRDLLGSPEGVRRLRPIVERLRQQVQDVIHRVNADDEPRSATIDGLVQVDVGDKVESGELGAYDVARPDPQREADRIVTNYLLDGAEQLPSDQPGAVLIDVDNSPAPSQSVDAILRWLNHPTEDGALYPHVQGALLVCGEWTEDRFVRLLHVVPVWRRGTPGVYRDRRFWARFAIGLNWLRFRKWEWMDERAEQDQARKAPS